MTVRDDILAFLRDAPSFSRSAANPDLWLDGLHTFAIPLIEAAGEHGLRSAQIAAWEGLAPNRAGLVLGPPGTGKTHLLSWFIVGYLLACRAAGRPCRVLVTAFTRNAIGNLLDAVAKRMDTHDVHGITALYVGAAPPDGLSAQVVRHPNTGPTALKALVGELAAPQFVLGASVWSVYKLLETGQLPAAEGLCAPVFDLICLDEASQMPLSHGLLALGGLAAGGRVVVAGDDKQLPPIRVSREVELGGRNLGGSLYAFLKSTQVSEFPLEETFRLNAPLAAFPKEKFYKDHYVSAVPHSRLDLIDDWSSGLADWERVALDPAWPICVLIHNGPSAATSSPFEAKIAAHLAQLLQRAMAGPDGTAPCDAATFWRERLAIVSPHRSHNMEIRTALGLDATDEAFVETVDRIQGKERDVVILSYCVSDSEFALAEAAFIFSQERLNVAATRARTKLILVISRALLDTSPTDQKLIDQAELLREFVFTCASKGTVHLPDAMGTQVPVELRVKSFTDAPIIADLVPVSPAEALPELTPQLQGVLEAVRQAALSSKYGTATASDLKKRLARGDDLLPDLVSLHVMGWISLTQRMSSYGPFWLAKPLDSQRIVFAANLQTVSERIEEVVLAARRSRLAPYYDTVRDRFAWMDASGVDRLRPHLETLAKEGRLVLEPKGNGLTVDLALTRRAAPPLDGALPPDLSDADFEVLNRLEDLEAERINFGVFEGWTSVADLAALLGRRREDVLHTLGRLDAHGYIMIAQDQRIRSRMAELAREVRYVKQRFEPGDVDRRPYLVRSLKLELRDRSKPRRDRPLRPLLAELAEEFSAQPDQVRALAGLGQMLEDLWGADPTIAGFQQRAMQALLRAWHGHGATSFVISADTGAGKTEAALLPLMAAAASDHLRGQRGTRAVIAYPRIRLAANQAQRIARYLSALAAVPAMPTLTLGLQVGQVPVRFDRLTPRDVEAGWESVSADTYRFPFFTCPADGCGQPLQLLTAAGVDGADRVLCPACGWSYAGWMGSKAGMTAHPPTFFLPTTDSLHQWMHNPGCGALFGDDPGMVPPRAILADEIHLYSHIHGAQVGHTLRRLLGRVAVNAPGAPPPLAVGMSATLGSPAQAWGRLVGRPDVDLIRPEASETTRNPHGREYFYFVQPEVESRGHDVAGASTTIQSLMCLAHGMRRRTGAAGGYRSLIFLDSIDKLRRLHSAYLDAEEGQVLSALRTRLYDDGGAAGSPRRECCREPYGCDRFHAGECWWFAANDVRQETAGGRLQPGSPLHVAREPVFSGTSGRVDDLIKGSDIVFSTSSLEVGFDDPDITLVYQHYAPQNLASFIQRKGRGGRGMDDRPITGVTLSIYSPRDSWWFRKPATMIEPKGFDVPINPDNFFVRRAQVLATVLDALARYQRIHGASPWAGPGTLTPVAWSAAKTYVTHLFGPEVWTSFGALSLEELWQEALKAGALLRDVVPLAKVREALTWVPTFLFETINLPALSVRLPDTPPDEPGKREDITLALTSVAPGNVSRRFHTSDAHWLRPVNGSAPWFAAADYHRAEIRPYRDGAAALLATLPLEARDRIGPDLLPQICRPTAITLEKVGHFFGAGWLSDWALIDEQGRPTLAPVTPSTDRKRRVRHETRGELRGFPVIKADPSLGNQLVHDQLPPWLARAEAYKGTGLGQRNTGLALLRVYWGADCEVEVEDPQVEAVPFAQLFTDPRSQKPLLHGFYVITEGVRFHIDRARLDAFVTAEMARLKDDEMARRWHTGQMMRYLVESRARAIGLNTYEAQRGAELFVAAAGDPDLRRRLNRLLRFWDQAELGSLFEDVRANVLSQHPLLSARRVARVSEALGQPQYRDLFLQVLDEVRREEALTAYLRSLVLHGLALRLKQSFLNVGFGNERQVLAHTKLPIQFGADAEDVITVAEIGSLGDGTTRTFVDRFDQAVELWAEGFLRGCPNAEEDAVLTRFFAQPHAHAGWRALDPGDPDAMRHLAEQLQAPEDTLPAVLLRILYETENIGLETIEIYDLAREIRSLDEALVARSGRETAAWELTSAAVRFAQETANSTLGRLLAAYRDVEDAAQEDSLSADARLADQVYRLSARLCVDGCQACLHQGGDLMADSLVATSVSRRLLDRFLEV